MPSSSGPDDKKEDGEEKQYIRLTRSINFGSLLHNYDIKF